MQTITNTRKIAGNSGAEQITKADRFTRGTRFMTGINHDNPKPKRFKSPTTLRQLSSTIMRKIGK